MLPWSFATSVNFLFFVHGCLAIYNTSSKSNVAIYWGQGAGQQRLSHFCAQSTVDIIAIAFVDVFPAQGNGFPGDNFGNQCWGPPYVYPGPGNNPSLNQLQSECPNIVADIPVCQSTYSKKIILSLGGSTQTYQLTGASSGTAFANFLWGAFGPQTPAWLASGLPRPFDSPNGQAVEVDGFDFDIEIPSTDNEAGYIAMASKLRTLFETASKTYLLTAAPQCVVPDANMGALIAAVAFDIIWVQFYDTPECSARTWIKANPNHIDGQPEASSGFSYHTWATFLEGTASTAAKLYIGVLGAPDSGNYYLSPTEISSLIDVYYCDERFGGVMIWEATSADNNAGGPYYSAVKEILITYDSKPPRLCQASTSTITSSTKKTSIKTSSSLTTTSSQSSSYQSSTLTKISTTVVLSILTKSSSQASTSTRSPSLQMSASSQISTSTKLSILQRSTSQCSSASSCLSTVTKTTTSTVTSIHTLITTSATSKPSISTSSSKPVTSSSSSSTKQSTISSSKSSITFRTTTSSKTTSFSASPLPSAPAGACGKPYGVSCAKGYCCSQYNSCGNTSSYCGAGCQSAFGACS